MRQRVRSDHPKRIYYFDQGITVCERWQSFANFLKDMGPKPTPKHTIDRYPNSAGNYEPGNCRWATTREQSWNKSCTIWVTYRGRKVRLMELVQELGVSGITVRTRLRLGWSLRRAISTPVRVKAKNPEPF